jgi:hypothetical protein
MSTPSPRLPVRSHLLWPWAAFQLGAKSRFHFDSSSRTTRRLAKNGRRDTYTLSGHNYICRVIGDTLCDADIGDAFTVGEVMAVGRCLLRLRRFLGVIWVRLVWNYGLGTSGCRMARLQIHKPRRAVHERALEKAFSRGHDVSVPTATTVATALIFEVHL